MPFEKAADEAARREQVQPGYSRALAQELADKPRAIDSVEDAALKADRGALNDQHDAASKAITDAMDSGDNVAEVKARAQREAIEKLQDINERATKGAGTKTAQGLAARNFGRTDDWSAPNLQTQMRAAYGDKMNDALRAHVDDLARQLKEAQDTIAKAQQKRAAKPQAQKMTPEERMQAKLEKQIADLEDRIQKRLKACPL